MPITVIVRSPEGEGARLTFDGTQRVVIGRGPGSDVRIPDASVSHRHATLRAREGDFAIVDEGSTNGTFVGSVRVAARTSRLVRAGDAVRVGRVWLELRTDSDPVTRDVALATRDLALALVARAMAAIGEDTTPRVRVVEGPDQGAELVLVGTEHEFCVGRGATCDLRLSDEVASREHVRIVRREGAVYLRDLGAKNGTFVGEHRLASHEEILWRPAHMVRLAQTVLCLEEPLATALARIEAASDECLGGDEALTEPGGPPEFTSPGLIERTIETADAAGPEFASEVASGLAESPAGATHASSNKRARSGRAPISSRFAWSATDLAVMLAALLVLALSLGGLVWLLRS